MQRISIPNRLAAPAIMLASGASLYLGAAIAVGLFDSLPPSLVAWLRIAAAGLILIALRRPQLKDFWGRFGLSAAIFGLVTLLMNTLFYEAIARLPLGTAVAIEFLGPIVVAALGSKSVRDWASLVLAAIGVLILSGAQWSVSPIGLAFIFGAAAAWAGYIVLGGRIATINSSTDRRQQKMNLAVGFTWAAAITLPLALINWPSDVAPHDPQFFGMVAGLGLLSAVIPYSLDQVVLRMAGTAYFSVLLALLPLTAAIIGAVTLGQNLLVAEWVGIALVVIAVVLRKPA